MKPLLPTSVAVALALAMGANVRAAPDTTSYRTFAGESLTLRPWKGDRIVFLTQTTTLEPSVMAKIVATLDKAHAWYERMTGRRPKSVDLALERAPIAEVERTCGAGCAYLGRTGIEIMPSHLRVLVDGVRDREQYDQVLFYELGRNFWFLGDRLEIPDDGGRGTMTTGYAVLMRFLSMEAAGVRGGPFNGHEFAAFRREVESLVDTYEQDARATWRTTLATGQGVANRMGLGATDLMASFLLRLRRDYGGDEFIRRFLAECGSRPPVTTTADAADNFVVAASRAARVNLLDLFERRWRFPVSDAARRALPSPSPGR